MYIHIYMNADISIIFSDARSEVQHCPRCISGLANSVAISVDRLLEAVRAVRERLLVSWWMKMQMKVTKKQFARGGDKIGSVEHTRAASRRESESARLALSPRCGMNPAGPELRRLG